jgi:hypothetical protein
MKLSKKTGIDAPRAPFTDPRVQKVYEILCSSDDVPPRGEHWEGWVARRIVDAIAPAVTALPDGYKLEVVGPMDVIHLTAPTGKWLGVLESASPREALLYGFLERLIPAAKIPPKLSQVH